MTWRELIKEMVSSRGVSKYTIGMKLGLAPNYITQLLKRRNDIKVGSLVRLCDALDYEVIVRKKNYLKAMEGEILLERDESSV